MAKSMAAQALIAALNAELAESAKQSGEALEWSAAEKDTLTRLSAFASDGVNGSVRADRSDYLFCGVV